MRVRVFVGILLAAAVGCIGSTDPFPTQREYAFLVLNAIPAEGGGYTSEPEAVFYRTPPLLLPRAQVINDTCVILSQTRPPGNVQPVFLDAGSPVTVSLSGNSATLVPVTTELGTTYKIANDGVIAFNPGDTAHFTVPGDPNGFPAFTLRAKTAEPFTIDPVAAPQGTEGVFLSWAPAPPVTQRDSKMVIQLKYTEIEGAGVQRREIWCELFDDGEHEIDPQLLLGWRNAPPDSREVVATRWRISTQTVSDIGLAQVISVFEVQGSVAP